MNKSCSGLSVNRIVMEAAVHAEAFKTGKETGSIPSSHVAPGAPPQPQSTADQVDKRAVCAAVKMAHAPPVAFLAMPRQKVAAQTCRRRSRRRLRANGRDQYHQRRPSSLLSFSSVASRGRGPRGGGGSSAGGGPYCPPLFAFLVPTPTSWLEILPRRPSYSAIPALRSPPTRPLLR